MRRTALLKLLVIFSLGPLACGTPGTAARSPGPAASLGRTAPAFVEAVGGAVWVGAHPWTELRRAWALPTKGLTEVSVAELPDGSGFEVRVSSDGRQWRGELDRERRARGPLVPIGPPPAPFARVDSPQLPGL